MVINFSQGKIIATAHEMVIKLSGDHMVTLQASIDAIQLIGRGANVISANGAECKWSIKLDDEAQLKELAETVGIAIL